MKKITFQGEYGAYSHLACTKAFPELKAIPSRTFESALDNVRRGECDLAMIPVENSVAGRVADIHYLLGGYDLKIYSEHFQKVEHQLLVKPGVNLNEVKYIRSHSMAIGQCQEVISELGLSTIVMADTAGSAKYISGQENSKDAAIASKLAAETYGLEIIKDDISSIISSVFPEYSAIFSTNALPITTASLILPTDCATSASLIPKPTASGKYDLALISFIFSSTCLISS